LIENTHLNLNLYVDFKNFNLKIKALFARWKDADVIDKEFQSNEIKFPRDFCFQTNFERSLDKVKQANTAIFNSIGKSNDITFDFSICKKVDSAALVFLQVMRLELMKDIRRLYRKFHKEEDKNITFIILPSKSAEVNRLLCVTGFMKKADVYTGLVEIDSMLSPINNIGYLKGNKSNSGKSDVKGQFTDRIVKYLDSCLNHHGYEFTGGEIVNMTTAVGEILGNAEDHCKFGQWYISANFSKEAVKKKTDKFVGEMNLTVLNFGDSIYEGYLSTKDKNHVQYNHVNNLVEDIIVKNPGLEFDKEQLFTVAIMQDTISRLRFEDDTRGTGTVTFVKSFLEIGDYKDSEKGYLPIISIISGKTYLILDHNCSPVKKGSIFKVILDKELNKSVSVDTAYLRRLGSKLPGTLIGAKIYFNKEHFDVKYGGES